MAKERGTNLTLLNFANEMLPSDIPQLCPVRRSWQGPYLLSRHQPWRQVACRVEDSELAVALEASEGALTAVGHQA